MAKRARSSHELPAPDPGHYSDVLPEIDPDFREIYALNWRQEIRTHTRRHESTIEYNLHMLNAPNAIEEFLWAIFYNQATSFKVNVSAGFIGMNMATGDLRYHYASHNDALFNRPLDIRSRRDFQTKLLDQISYDRLFEHVSLLAPESGHRPAAITNLTATITPMPYVPITGGVILEQWLTNNKGIMAMEADSHGRPYDDKLCAFRCYLAFKQDLHLYQRHGDGLAVVFCERWMAEQGIAGPFEGITLDDMDAFEEFCHTPIAIYSLIPYVPPKPRLNQDILDATQAVDELPPNLDELDPVELAECEPEYTDEEFARLRDEAIEKHNFTARLVRRSNLQGSDNTEQRTMFLNLYQSQDSKVQHFSYITLFGLYSRSWQCNKCNRVFPIRSRMERHQKACKGDEPEQVFPGYGFVPRPTIFEQLADEGICVPEGDRYRWAYAAFDFEACSEALPYLPFTPIPADPNRQLPPAAAAAEDYAKPPSAAENKFLHDNWLSLYQRTGPVNDYAVVRIDVLDQRLKDHIYAFATMQASRFVLHVKLLVREDIDDGNGGGRLRRLPVLRTQTINDLASLTAELNKIILPNLRKRYMDRPAAAAAYRLIGYSLHVDRERQDFVAKQVPASVSVASNVPYDLEYLSFVVKPGLVDS